MIRELTSKEAGKTLVTRKFDRKMSVYCENSQIDLIIFCLPFSSKKDESIESDSEPV